MAEELENLEVSPETTQEPQVEETASTPVEAEFADFINVKNNEPIQEDAKAEEVKDEKVEDIKPYTDEEYHNIIKNNESYDPNRLTPAQKVLSKDLERYFQKRYQQNAEKEKELLALQEKLTQPRQATEVTEEQQWKNAYLKDPVAVMDYLNGAIINYEQVDPLSEGYKDARVAIAKITAFKDKLQASAKQEIINSQKANEFTSTVKIMATDMLNEVRKEIPDFNERSQKLTEFAISRLGYSNAELQEETAPVDVYGNNRVSKSVKFIKMINDLYNKANAGKSAESKRKVTVPKVSNNESSTISAKKTKQNYSQMSPHDFEQHMQNVALGRARIA